MKLNSSVKNYQLYLREVRLDIARRVLGFDVVVFARLEIRRRFGRAILCCDCFDFV
jgi:hypothetical protein